MENTSNSFVERKLAVMVSDVTGFTQLARRSDVEVAVLLDADYALRSATLRAHGGRVVKSIASFPTSGAAAGANRGHRRPTR